MSAPLHNSLESYIKMHDTKINKLSKEIGRGRGQIRRYRMNEIQPPQDVARKICQFYGIGFKDLFYFPTDNAQQRSDRGIEDKSTDGASENAPR